MAVTGRVYKNKYMTTKIRVSKICDHCKKEFIAKTTKTRYCSHACNKRHYKVRKRAEKVGIVEQEVAKKKAAVRASLESKMFLNIQEAAVLIGVSERTFYRLMKEGAVKALKLRGRTIIHRGNIDALFF